MNDLLFSRRLQAISSLESESFADLVRASGMDPRYDFVQADLSGTDLRNEDLTAFDFSHANFDRAQIAGALFNKTVRTQQLTRAICDLNLAVIPIGVRFLALHDQITRFLGNKIYLSRAIRDALAQLADDPDRRLRRTGAFVGDHSDLVRRRLSRPFREAAHTFQAASRCLIMFEPDSELDFDILDWTLKTLERARVPAYVFAFPHTLDDKFGMFTRRMGAVLPERFVTFEGTAAHWRSGFAEKDSRQFSLLERARELALGFTWAAAHATLVRPSSTGQYRIRPSGRDGVRFDIGDGRRNAGEPLSEAVIREAGKQGVYGGSQRGLLLIRDDILSTEDDTTALRTLGKVTGPLNIATYPMREKMEAEFYLAYGGLEAIAWDVILPSLRSR